MAHPPLVASGDNIAASHINAIRNSLITAAGNVAYAGNSLTGVGAFSAATGAFSGAVTAASLALSGALTGVTTGSFSGAVSAASLVLSGSITGATTVTASGAINSASLVTTGNVTAGAALAGATLAVSGAGAVGGASNGGRLSVNITNDTGDGIRINGASSSSFLVLSGIHGGGVNGYGRIAFWDGASLGIVRIQGGVSMPELPGSSPGAGTKRLYYDPADGNRVKFAA